MTQHVPNWYTSFFGQDYLEVYGHLFAREASEAEAQFVRRTLELKPGEKVLDLCCGQGRHAVPLAREGLAMTGLDMTESYLELAKSAAHEAGVRLNLVRGDMRELRFEQEFDAVINMFTAFGYFDDEADDQRVLDGAARALKAGGRILLDLLNRDWVAANYVRSERRTGPDGTVFIENRKFDSESGRNHIEFTIIDPDGAERTTGHHIRLYVATEISRMLAGAGLAVQRMYGGYDGEPLSVDSRRMIVVATKPS
jgi:SAM-dependent methyltransferase